MNYWWSADLHLGHGNIVKYCDRRLYMNSYEKSVMEKGVPDEIKKLKISKETQDKMNAGLIKNWNSVVKSEDIVFHVGDFCFRNSRGGKPGEGLRAKAKEWETQLKGKIIHIRGNHDKNNSTKTIIEGLLIKMGGRRIYCVHKPDHCNYDYEINFTGHVHTNWKFKQYTFENKKTDCINVGVDVWNYTPVKFTKIIRDYSRWVRLGRPEQLIKGGKDVRTKQ